MQNRWAVLALLFTVRLAMGFQFQAVGAVSPAYMKEFGVALADIGLMISLYHAPGLVFAVPGGEIGRRFGEKPMVLLALVLMIIGGLTMAFAHSWGWQLGGRLVAGVGGVLLNVLMSKMVTDWFAGKEIATAMAIFVNSWPAGIAVALVVLPVVVGWGGAAAVGMATVVVAVLGLVLLGLLYAPPVGQAGAVGRGVWPAGAALQAVVVAGCIWGLYNAALSMVFGYGTALLTERGWSLTAAGSATSLVLWAAVDLSPVGGVVADRTGRPARDHAHGLRTPWHCAGHRGAQRRGNLLVRGAGPGWRHFGGTDHGTSGPRPRSRARAAGMGLYFAMFYVMVVAGPIVAGRLAEQAGTSRIAFDFGAAMLVVCFGLFWLYQRLQARHTRLSSSRDMKCLKAEC